MSFIVRQISRTAEGRRIVRPQVIARDVLTVGRATTSDVHLADLAVTLNHGTIRRLGADRIAIATDKSLPFTVNGRSVAEIELAVATGAEVHFGSHRLLIARDEETGEPRIDVERIEASGREGGKRVFSLAGRLPGKRASAWVLVGLIIALFLAWPVWTAIHGGSAGRLHADASWSPGALSAAHRNLEGNCQACHKEPFVAVRDASCRACHAQVHDHADPRRLATAMASPNSGDKLRIAFQTAFNVPQGRCVDCHLEHEGAGRMTPTRQRLCADCHGALSDRLPDTALFDAGDFGTAHPQFRPLIPVGFDGSAPILWRASLDTRPTEDEGLEFSHALHLSTNGAAAKIAREPGAGRGEGLGCGDCHVADGAGFRPIEMTRDCQACHSLAFDRRGGVVRTLPHGDPRAVVAALRASPAAPGAAIAAVFSPGGACYGCHIVTRADDPLALDYAIYPVVIPQRYFSKGWFDHSAHTSERCESCHAARTSTSASDVLIPGIASCRTCHGGEASGAKVPSSCAMCHDYHRPDGAPFAVKAGRRGEGAPADAAMPGAAIPGHVAFGEPEALFHREKAG